MKNKVLKIVVAAVLLLGFSAACAQTPPPAYTPAQKSAYVKGWTDRGSQPTTRPSNAPATSPSTLPTVGIPPLPVDLADKIETAHSGEVITLEPGSAYRISRSVTVIADGVSIRGNGARVFGECTPGHSAALEIRGSHATFSDFTIETEGIAFYVLGPDCTIDRCTVADGAINAVKSDLALRESVGGEGLTLSYCDFGLTSSISAYIARGNTRVTHCKFAGSMAEYSLRQECDSQDRAIPTGCVYDSNDIDGHPAFGKQVVGIRMGSCVFSNNLVHGSIRVGQGSAFKIGQFNDPVVIEGNTFTSNTVGQQTVEIYSGSRGSVIGNIFSVGTSNLPAIAVAANSEFLVSRNVQQRPASGLGSRLIGTSHGIVRDDKTNTIQVKR